MAIALSEKFTSRKINSASSGASQERTYTLTGSDDEDALLTALADETDASITVESDTWYRSGRTIAPVGYQIWEGRVTYTPLTGRNLPVDQSQYRFETGGGSQHVSSSIKNISNTKAGDYTPDAPNFGGLINVTSDGVDGIDIIAPIFNFSEMHVLSADTVTEAYKVQLMELTATKNAAAFRGIPAGSVLFMGASGSSRDDGNWNVTFNFAAQKKLTSYVLFAGTAWTITVPEKLGWNYLWIRYHDVWNDKAKMNIKRPLSAHVEQVYGNGDFSLLEI